VPPAESGRNYPLGQVIEAAAAFKPSLEGNQVLGRFALR
jgi:hypothetical protein